jgi:hypothetical protein
MQEDPIAESRDLQSSITIFGDYQAVKNGRVGRRIGRRLAGKVTGRALGKLFG